MSFFGIEQSITTWEYRVIEFTKNGFLVLGSYDDREVAEDRMEQWKREWKASKRIGIPGDERR
jgi:hypothetical protein